MFRGYQVLEEGCQRVELAVARGAGESFVRQLRQPGGDVLGLDGANVSDILFGQIAAELLQVLTIGADRRMYQLGGAANVNRSSNRPLTQASRK